MKNDILANAIEWICYHCPDDDSVVRALKQIGLNASQIASYSDIDINFIKTIK